MSHMWIAITGLTLLVLIGSLTMLRILRSRERQLHALRQQIEILQADVNALCAGAVGTDRRIAMLENQGRLLDHRQESMESGRQQDERPYGEAIQMVQEGAGADDLMERLGLSLSEADLVVMLHGVKKAG